MSHHLLPHIDRGWLGQVTNCFLLRDPAEVITSYVKKAPDPDLSDTGFPQLAEIFTWVCQHTGKTPPVLDARDVLEDPRKLLGLLCDALEVPFTDAMLSWPAGLRPTDGIWAKHWYTEVACSTSFQPYRSKAEPVPERLARVYDQCCLYYQMLYPHRLR